MALGSFRTWGFSRSLKRHFIFPYTIKPLKETHQTQYLNVSPFVLQLSLPNPLSWEWRCSWSSAGRRCFNYIWMIKILLPNKVRLIWEVWRYFMRCNWSYWRRTNKTAWKCNYALFTTHFIPPKHFLVAIMGHVPLVASSKIIMLASSL